MSTATPFDVNSLLEIMPKENVIRIITDQMNSHLLEHDPVFQKAARFHATLQALNGSAAAPAGSNQRTPKKSHHKASDTPRTNYSQSMTWWEKIEYFLKRNPAGLSRRSLVDLISRKDGITADDELKSLSNSLSSSLNGRMNKGELIGDDSTGLFIFTLPDNKPVAKSTAGPSSSISDSAYDPNGSWYDKMKVVLRRHPDGLTARDISLKIASLERKTSKPEVETIVGSVSARASSGVKDKIFTKEIVDGITIYKLAVK